MTLTPLGEFEVVVLMSVLHCSEPGREAYGSAIRDEIEARSGRPAARGAVYVTLDRLEEKGYLQSRFGDATPRRGGRPKRIYRVTAAGVRVLKQSVGAMARMYKGLEPLLGDF
jgi:PadR family transcriptional regulator PadR